MPLCPHFLVRRSNAATIPSNLVEGARVKHYPKSQIILYSGDEITDLYILKHGVVKMYDIDHQGNEKVLHLLKPPCIMPLTALRAHGHTTQWFYSAITDCDVYTLYRAEIERRIADDGQLAVYLMNQFAGEMHELLVRLSSLGKTDARGKLVCVLRFLAVCHSSPRHNGWRRVTFPVRHQLLADMIGMTRESAAISMKHLRNLHVIRNPRLTILEIHLDHLAACEKALDKGDCV